MLREIEGVKQHPGEPVRRIFNSDSVNLTVWQSDNEINSFQIIHQYENGKYLLTWSQGKSFSCRSIDDGEHEPSKHKMTPIATNSLSIDNKLILDILPHIKTGVELIDSAINESFQSTLK